MSRIELHVEYYLLRETTLTSFPGLTIIPLSCISCTPSILSVRRSILGTSRHPEVFVVSLQLISSIYHYIIDCYNSIRLRASRMLLTIVACIIEVRTRHHSLGSILGNTTIIAITTVERISIGRNIGNSILEVIKDSLVNILNRCTRNVFLRWCQQQRYITEQASHIKIQDSTDGASLTENTTLHLVITTPIDGILCSNQLITAKDSCIIVLPICIEQVVIRRSNTNIKLVNHIVILGIRKTQTCKSLI